MNRKVLILVNHEIVIYNFRKELVYELLARKYEVYISAPSGEKIKELVGIGCHHIETEIDRHGKNIIKDYKLYRKYLNIMKTINPFVVLTYTIKPNLFGGFAASKIGIPYIANITGLGTALENKSFLQFLIIKLYKKSFSKINKVFVQNKENLLFFEKNKIAMEKIEILPGSGVNLIEFKQLDYPVTTTIEFAFISRIMKSKGIELYLEAAKKIKMKYPQSVFHVAGFCEQNYEDRLIELDKQEIIVYHGMLNDIKPLLKRIHCLIHPSNYPEGISNILLEAAASGRPIITTDRSGCIEVVDEGFNGYVIRKNSDSTELISAIEKFIHLSVDEKIDYGIYGRRKMEIEFDRRIIVNQYLKEIDRISSAK